MKKKKKKKGTHPIHSSKQGELNVAKSVDDACGVVQPPAMKHHDFVSLCVKEICVLGFDQVSPCGTQRQAYRPRLFLLILIY